MGSDGSRIAPRKPMQPHGVSWGLGDTPGGDNPFVVPFFYDYSQVVAGPARRTDTRVKRAPRARKSRAAGKRAPYQKRAGGAPVNLGAELELRGCRVHPVVQARSLEFHFLRAEAALLGVHGEDLPLELHAPLHSVAQQTQRGLAALASRRDPPPVVRRRISKKTAPRGGPPVLVA